MVPGWSGSVPVQLIFFNSYILNTFLYKKKKKKKKQLSMGTQFHFEQDIWNFWHY